MSLSLLYRDYQRDFQDIYSVGSARAAGPRNERGLYTGIEVRPSREWSFNAYFDQWRFPGCARPTRPAAATRPSVR